jgi:micrococcal nuclease
MSKGLFPVALAGVAAAGAFVGVSLPSHAPSAQVDEVRFGLCHTGGGTNCVVDGDTIWLHGVKIRIADIDAPETHPPRCASEGELGDRATSRLRQLLNAGPFEVEQRGERDEDRFGRKLRVLARHGKSLGDTLVAEGLARKWDGARHPWC